MLKSTSHRSIQHAKITKKPQYKNQIERKHTFQGFLFDKTHSLFSEIHKYTFFTNKTNLLRNNIIDNS